MLAVAGNTTGIADAGGGVLLERGGGWRGARKTGIYNLAERAERFGACIELVW